MKFRAACIQMSSGPEIAPNLETAGTLVRTAHKDGAQFIALPENVDMLMADRARKLAAALPEDKHPGLPFFAGLARETGTWIMCGSLAIKLGAEKIANRCYLFNPEGKRVAAYDKIHMFDVDLPNGESYRESETCAPGDRAVLAPVPWGKLGMTICYDMRFPMLYRALAEAGASIITVPAAFTVPTGQAHWHILLRTRAVETGCFVLAPAQCGTHDGGRKTYGHALIVSPWGKILAEAENEPGFIAADLDIDEVAKTRASLPSLQHGRNFQLPN
ncbi:MAG: carbon-nitrogen hydrolase family protein [Alphaproteobacteria bacterium]|nr:carbon-nitrogen hydrolase family protein [Alphaproteobacteria bacterium]